TSGRAAARRELDRLVALFGADNVAVEITATDDPRDADLHAALADLAADARLPLVATTAAHYAHPRDADLAGALAAVRARSSLDDLDGWLPGAPTTHLRSAAEMLARHHRHPQAVANAAAPGDECAFALQLAAPHPPPSPPSTRCGTGCCSSASSRPSGTARRTSTSTSSPRGARRSSSTSTRRSGARTPRRSRTSSPTGRSRRCATRPGRWGTTSGRPTRGASPSSGGGRCAAPTRRRPRPTAGPRRSPSRRRPSRRTPRRLACGGRARWVRRGGGWD